MSLFRGSKRTYSYLEREGSDAPLYVIKEKHENAVTAFLDQEKIKKQGELVGRLGSWNRLDENPLSLEVVSDSEIIALLTSYTYIYNQRPFGRPRVDANANIPDEIDWNPQDYYVITRQISTVSLPFAFDCFEVERYKDNTYQKEVLDSDSIALSERDFRVPTILQGRESYERTIKRYKEFFFLLPALEAYCVENENLNGDHESDRGVEDFLNNEVSLFFDMETYQPLLPGSYNSSAPNVNRVSDYIQGYNMDDVTDRR